MKKIFMILLCFFCVTTANARVVVPTYSQGYNTGYSVGHRDGKNDAYNNVGRTVFFVGTAIIVGALIYTLGQESNWTAHNGQVGYRF